VNLEKELKNIPITLSWENIIVHTPSSKESLTGKLEYLICKKETPPKKIINNGNMKKINNAEIWEKDFYALLNEFSTNVNFREKSLIKTPRWKKNNFS
jgi:hypothetical protein